MAPNTTSVIISIMPLLKRQSCPVVDFMITSVINHIDSRLVLTQNSQSVNTFEDRGIVLVDCD
jgi:hypothetical protein